jgi:hypothetical protein
LARRNCTRLFARAVSEPLAGAVCAGFRDTALLVRPDKPLRDGADTAGRQTTDDGDDLIRINPRKTRFIMVQKQGLPERIRWKSLFLVQTGTTVALGPEPRRFGRRICVFHEEKNAAILRERLASIELPVEVFTPVKAYSVAAGAFLEFLIFLESVTKSEPGAVTIAALVAIFGKALPYLPPGLFFTIASVQTKKSRQRRVAGFLLMTAGVILNIAVVFFLVRKIGFS